MGGRVVIHICIRVFFFVLVIFKKIQKLGADHLPQHGFRDWVRLSVVIYVHIHPIHHIEMRIGEQFFHSRIFHFWRDFVGHELGVVGVFGETLDVGHRRSVFLLSFSVTCSQAALGEVTSQPVAGRAISTRFLRCCGRSIGSDHEPARPITGAYPLKVSV